MKKDEHYFPPWGYLEESRGFTSSINSLKELKRMLKGIEKSYQKRKFVSIDIKVSWPCPQIQTIFQSCPPLMELVVSVIYGLGDGSITDIADELGMYDIKDLFAIEKIVRELEEMDIIGRIS